MKDIREYLPLYIGAFVVVTTPITRFQGILKGVYYDQWRSGRQIPHEMTCQVFTRDGAYYMYKVEQVKLQLRSLDSMTDAEFKECQQAHPEIEKWKYIGQIDGGKTSFDAWSPYVTKYLLSKGFDIFGLIDAGLALDKNNLV